MRTFQITNADVKYVQTVLKTMLKVKDISVDERSGTLVMRDTADAIAVAAKVIAAHDVPEAEVMLEVEVLEVAHDRLQNLGFEPPNAFSIATPDSANTAGCAEGARPQRPGGVQARHDDQLQARGLRRQHPGQPAHPRAQQGEGAHPDRRPRADHHQHGDAGVDRQQRGDRLGAVPGRRA